MNNGQKSMGNRGFSKIQWIKGQARNIGNNGVWATGTGCV